MKGASVLFVLTAIAPLCSVMETGGWTEHDPSSDPKYLELAHFAISQHTNDQSNYNTVLVLLKVRTQVVNGLNYELVFEIAPTNCPVADGGYSRELCTPTDNKAAAVCTAIVYERPWDDYRKLQSMKCE
ncbi:salivary cystatin-L2-like [Rhipicephalus sanguineus]|uniref:salivary cystatin-L2-like n=1 Tax=Rhipicephalus sanguineus TaxID=34632 RepID=UPI001893D6D8|nr:salivary cystatin-L2-like [Rhipicephalus sanguineus]